MKWSYWSILEQLAQRQGQLSTMCVDGNGTFQY